MARKKTVIVSPEDLKERVENTIDSSKVIYRTQNIYLSSFLISQENFKLGKIYIEDLTKSNQAWIEIEYDIKYKLLLDNYLDIFNKNKAVVNLNNYQQNIRFIMHIVNKRKSGIED